MPPDKETFTQDGGTGDDSVWSIDVYQSGSLIAFSRRLSTCTMQARDQQEEACYATATILLAAAALEALLSEFAYLNDRCKYSTNEFRKAGVPRKYEILSGKDLAIAYPEIAELWAHRIAIGHSEPDNRRSTVYGTRVNKAGATWVVTTLESFARALWGADIPSWLRRDAGL